MLYGVVTRALATRRRRRRLGDLPLFAGAPSHELDRVDALATETVVDEGRVLTRQGDRGTQGFVVVEGRVAVLVDDDPVAVLGPGQLVGELAMLRTGERTATVITLTPTTVLAMHATELRDLLDTTEVIGRRIEELAADRAPAPSLSR